MVKENKTKKKGLLNLQNPVIDKKRQTTNIKKQNRIRQGLVGVERKCVLAHPKRLQRLDQEDDNNKKSRGLTKKNNSDSRTAALLGKFPLQQSTVNQARQQGRAAFCVRLHIATSFYGIM